jgi:Kef-type K+ transport system membrane component KefB
MGFGTLLVIALAGLAGPLLALNPRYFVSVVVGEILAGIVVGPTVLEVVDPANPTLEFLSRVGFAMLMFTVGLHLPLRDPRLRSALRPGALLALTTAVLAVPAGIAAAAIAGTSHASIYAVVLASGSAAVLLPALEEAGAGGPDAFVVMAQVTLADVATIVSVPIVLRPARAGEALLGGALVTATVIALFGLSRAIAGHEWLHRARRLSRRRAWALDLRVALIVLFLLAWIAEESGTSVLIAGFAAGVMVALVGGPKRLSTQVRGVADGFLVPLFFVVLGAQLDLGGLFEDPSILALAAALAALNVAIHLASAALLGRPPRTGLAACAQLGVPAAVASLGLADHVITPQVATAVIAAALVSLGVCSAGVVRVLARS